MALRRRQVRLLRQIGGWTLAVIVCLLVTEWVFRGLRDKTLDPKDNPMFAFDAVAGHLFKPYLSAEKLLPNGERIILDINSLGLRDAEVSPREPGEIRIFGLGDAEAAGTGVPLSSTYLKQIEKRAQAAGAGRAVRTINGAVDGYNLEQVSGLLAKLGKTVDPDLVLLGLNVGDDVGEYGEDTGLAIPGKAFLRKHSYLYHVVQRGYHRVRHRGTAETPVPEGRRAEWEAVFARHGESLDADQVDRYVRAAEREAALYRAGGVREIAWTSTAEMLRRIRDQSQRLGAEFILVLLPTRRQVDPGEWEKTIELLHLEPGASDPERPEKRLAEIAMKQEIPTVDLLPVLRNYPHPDSLFFPGSAHWTSLAHDLAAGAVYDFLSRGGYLQGAR